MSGHSRWAQIKHKKALTDAKKGQLFSKLVREIMVAVRAGGAGLDTNPRLRSAMERARSIGLPKDNIDRAVSRASGGEDGTTLQEFLFEAASPDGVLLIIEGITDNRNRALAEIRHILAGFGAKLASPGSVLWNFEKVGLIELAPGTGAAKTEEEAGLAIIDAGAHDFKVADDLWIVETDFHNRDRVHKNLEKRGLETKGVGHDYKPRATVSPPENTKGRTEELLDALAEHEDVQEVYTNLQEE